MDDESCDSAGPCSHYRKNTVNKYGTPACSPSGYAL